jgi:hypothetical protein
MYSSTGGEGHSGETGVEVRSPSLEPPGAYKTRVEAAESPGREDQTAISGRYLLSKRLQLARRSTLSEWWPHNKAHLPPVYLRLTTAQTPQW